MKKNILKIWKNPKYYIESLKYMMEMMKIFGNSFVEEIINIKKGLLKYFFEKRIDNEIDSRFFIGVILITMFGYSLPVIINMMLITLIVMIPVLLFFSFNDTMNDFLNKKDEISEEKDTNYEN